MLDLGATIDDANPTPPCRPAQIKCACTCCCWVFDVRCRRPRSLCLAAATRQRNSPRSATPPACLQSELAVVERAPTSESYARVDFHPECEAAINEQINIE